MSQPPAEIGFIAQLRRRAEPGSRPATLRLGIGDDCAVLRPPSGHDVLVTTDFSLEGRHFRRDWHPARSAGHRCLARGLSDLAAMGARPMAAFLSLALPAGTLRSRSGARWVQGFLEGLLALAEETHTPLAGGDTSTAPGDAILADIVLTGSAPRGRELRRSGATAGDAIYVTGALGGSAAELKLLADRPGSFRSARPQGRSAGARSTAEHPHLFPQPRLAVGQTLLRRRLATAAMDVSDGLSTDLLHLCRESGCAALLDGAAVPIHPLAAGRSNSLSLALHGGEDYELLFTAKPGSAVPKTIAGVRVQRVGYMVAGSPAVMINTPAGTEPLPPGGWEHQL